MTENKIPNPNVNPKTNQNARTRRIVNRNQQIPNKKVKKGTSIGGKGILIGILVLLILIIAIMFFFFFYLTNNPNAAKGLGMGPSSIKSITSVFAGILFGSLFVLFLILGLINIYRLATKKEGKTKYGIASFIIFILGITNITFGVIVFNKINKIKTGDIIASTNVLIGNIEFTNKNNPKKASIISLYNNKYPLIGPIKISFLLNKDMFNRVYYPQILNKEKGGIIPVSFILNCGNGQIINYNGYDFPPKKYCLYLKKGKYNIGFKFVYNTKNEKNKEFILPGKTINIDSQVNILSKYTIKNKNEIIIGRVGNTIKLDLSNIPIDLNLDSNTLGIDFIGNGKFQDTEGVTTFSYKTTGVHYINIKIPGNENYPIYRIPVRVLSSNRPMCNISIKKDSNGEYLFKLNTIPYAGNPIVKYNYKLLNITNNNIVEKGKREIFKKILNNGSDYQIKYEIVDSKGNKGECKSNIIKLSDKVDYKYNIKINNKIFTGNNIIYEVNKLPSSYNIKVGNIFPNNNDTEVGFDIDGDQQIDEKGKNYSFTIKEKKGKTINVIVKDIYGNISIKTIKFVVKLKNVIAQLNANRIKGPIPLKVKFDASTSIVNNPNDQIVFFDWDFGDGNTNNKTNQGVIEHTYTKYGTYTAKVTVETEKGFKDTAKIKIFAQKQLNTATITFPNNLGGQVAVGDTLKIDLNSNGAIKSVSWDFGDGKIFSCEGRECMEIDHTYMKKGLYKISAKINFIDGSPSTTTTASINVIDN